MGRAGEQEAGRSIEIVGGGGGGGVGGVWESE